mgnify:CR=1 FL=1
MAVILTFPEISMPISSNTWLTTASCSSSSPDSSKIESNVSLTVTKKILLLQFDITELQTPFQKLGSLWFKKERENREKVGTK